MFFKLADSKRAPGAISDEKPEDTRMKHSIIRRSSAVAIVYVLGHALGYVLMLAANYILDTAEFGLFYTVWKIITVAMAPATALLLVLGRRLADTSATLGRAAVARLTVRLLGLCLRWGFPAAIVAGILLVGGGAMSAHDDWVILLLTPAVILVLIFTEVLRNSFQALLLFQWSSAVWLASQAAQGVLSIIGLAISHRVWPGILGILAGASLVLVAFAPWFVREARQTAPQRTEGLPLLLGQETRLVISYSLFVLITNMDILVAYWLLPTDALGVYAASALLPKAIITATFPIAQVVLPVLVEQQADGLSVRHSILKALALAVSMGAGAAGLLWVGVSPLQNSPLAVRGLDFTVVMILAIGAIGLSALRVLVVVEIAMQRFAGGFIQILAVVLFVGTCIVLKPHVQQLAEVYAIVSWIFLVIIAFTVFLSIWPNLSRVMGSHQP